MKLTLLQRTFVFKNHFKEIIKYLMLKKFNSNDDGDLVAQYKNLLNLETLDSLSFIVIYRIFFTLV